MALALTVAADVEPLEFVRDSVTCGESDKCFMKESPDSGRQSCSSNASSIFQLPFLSEDEFSSTLSIEDGDSKNNGTSVEVLLECVESKPSSTPPPSPPSLKPERTFHRSFSSSCMISSTPFHLPDDAPALRRRRHSLISYTTVPAPPPHSPPVARACTIPAPPPPPPLPGNLSWTTDLPDLDLMEAEFPLQASCRICGDDVFSFYGKMLCCNTRICESCILIHTLDHSDDTHTSIPCPNATCKSHIYSTSIGPGPLPLGELRTSTEVLADNEPDIAPVSECIVCYTELRRRSRQRSRRPCCSEMVCRSCMTEIIHTNIESEGQIHIACPNPDCDGVVTREEIHSHADVSTKNKYERLRLNQSRTKNRKTCPNCCEITEHSLPRKLWRYEEKDVRITCKKCNHDWCFNCHAPWHKDVKCREFQKGDKRFKKWTASSRNGVPNCQKCPLCRVYIQRSQGCNHMTCNRCTTSFCYRCGGFYSLDIPGLGGHHDHMSIFGCKYNYKEHSPTQRRALRGGYFGAKMAMLTGYPVLFVAGAAVVLIGGAIALPIYGAYRYHKYRKNIRRLHGRRRH